LAPLPFGKFAPDGCAGDCDTITEFHIRDRQELRPVPTGDGLCRRVKNKDLRNQVVAVVLAFCFHVLLGRQDLEDNIHGPGWIGAFELFENTINMRARIPIRDITEFGLCR